MGNNLPAAARRFLRGLVACIGLVSTLGVSGAAAQQGTASLRGRVVDAQESALPGVTVTVTHVETSATRTTVSGDDGTYLVPNLLAGRYSVTAELAGFRTTTRTNVALAAAVTQTLDFTLEIGQFEEMLTVVGAPPTVDVTSTQTGGHIRQEEVQSLPSFTRSATGFLQAIPGVVYQTSTNKPSTDTVSVFGLPTGNQFLFDGGTHTGAVSTSAIMRIMVPTDVVQEIVAITSQLPAEYGGRTSGVFNIISKQGGNQFHGSAYGFFNNDTLSAPTYFQKRDGLTEPEFKKHNEGFSIGGPILRNRLFFFGLLEYTSQQTVLTGTFPTNPDKNYSTTTTINGYNPFIRVDHRVNDRNTYAVRFLGRKADCLVSTSCRAGGVGSPNVATRASAFDALSNEWEIDSTVVGSYNATIGTRMVNSLVYSSPRQFIQTGPTRLSRRDPGSLTSDPCIDCGLPTLRYLSFDDQISYFDHPRSEPQYRIEDSLSWFVPGNGAGSHDVKVGGFYNYANHQQNNYDAENGIFEFAGNRAFDPADPSTYPERLTIRNGPQESNPNLHSTGFYVQDKWQLNRLTLNLGLRYDLALAATPNENNPLFPADKRDGYPVDKNNFQPRIGVAYASNDNKAVWRAGFAQYYTTPSLREIELFHRQGIYEQGLIVTFPESGVADPGPSSGRLPTDPMLVNGPVVNRALLNQLSPAGAPIRNKSAVYLDNPDRELPRARQISAGYERQLPGQIGLSLDYIRRRGTGNIVEYDLNPGLRSSTSRTAPIARTDLLGLASQLGLSPFTNSVITYKNLGREHFDGMTVSIERRYSGFFSARGAYTLARVFDDLDQANFQVLAESHPESAWGRSARKHIFNMSGRFDVPKIQGLNVSGSLRLLSGNPMTLINTNTDSDRNGSLNDRLPAGVYSGNGKDALTDIDYDGSIGGAIGPGFTQLDFRLGYRIPLKEGRNLDISGDFFNLTNAPNFANPSADQRVPGTFLVPTTLVAAVPRQLQLSVRLAF